MDSFDFNNIKLGTINCILTPDINTDVILLYKKIYSNFKLRKENIEYVIISDTFISQSPCTHVYKDLTIELINKLLDVKINLVLIIEKYKHDYHSLEFLDLVSQDNVTTIYSLQYPITYKSMLERMLSTLIIFKYTDRDTIGRIYSNYIPDKIFNDYREFSKALCTNNLVISSYKGYKLDLTSNSWKNFIDKYIKPLYA